MVVDSDLQPPRWVVSSGNNYEKRKGNEIAILSTVISWSRAPVGCVAQGSGDLSWYFDVHW